ncbi:MAG TPA: hypothetical protein VME19_11410 [Streptosporangiaceae bacterium]|nr:hypothetical protein [Streptosporangiaceae bacterium]
MGHAGPASAGWSHLGGADCVRLSRLAPGTDVQVRPVLAVAGDQFPAMAGRLVRDGDDLCFVPRFPFVDGTSYTIALDGVAAAVLTRPRPEHPATTRVLAIYPTAAQVPRNLLRCYIWFSAPMSEGHAARHVRLVDDASGEPMAGALLATEGELWSAHRRRLTVLLDPARIKRGLATQRDAGYPLQRGRPFRLVVDGGFRDALGRPLASAAERRYAVGDDERRHVGPGTWAVAAPPAGTREPLEVTFGRPLDAGLLAWCLRVTGPGGPRVAGLPEPGPEERSWRLTPREPWSPGGHQLVVDPVLEDLAGNSVSRVFDRDVTRPEDGPAPDRPVAVAFRPS